MKLRSHSIPRLLSGLWLLLIPSICSAQAAALANFLESFLLTQVMIAAGGVILLFVFYYGARMIFESQNESAITDARKSFINALVGFAVLAAMYPLRLAFVTGDAFNPVNTAILIPEFTNLRSYIIVVAEGIFVLMMTLHAFRLLTSRGDEGETDKVRKALIMNILGAVLILLANVIVTAVMGGDAGMIAVELAGIAGFMITLIGGIAVLALIVAGILLIVSVDESLKERAKKIVGGSIIAIIIALVSYVVLLAFAASTTP